MVPQPANGDADKFLNASGGWSLVNSAGIQDGTITSTDILDGTITSTDIYDGTITSTDISNETISAADIGGGAVGTSELADGSIQSIDIQNGTITNSDISSSAAHKIDWLKLNITKSNIISLGIADSSVYNGSAVGLVPVNENGHGSNYYLNASGGWSLVNSAGIQDGTITSTDILDGTISAADIGGGVVGTSELADGSIQSIDIQNGTITNADILDKTIINNDISDSAAIAWSKINTSGVDFSSNHSHGSASHTHNETDLNGIPEGGNGNANLFLNQQGNWTAPTGTHGHSYAQVSHGHSYMRDVFHISQSSSLYWSNIYAATINNYCKDNDGCIVKITYKNGATIDIETFSLDYSSNYWKASNGENGTDNNNIIESIHNTIGNRCYLFDSDVYAGEEWDECIDITNGDVEYCNWQFMNFNDTDIGWTLRRSTGSGTCHLSIRD